jgi:hypothetical protein
MNFDDPWSWMQPYDVRRFGEVIRDKAEQERWCRAVLLGGLPFMWRKAEVARNLIYDRLELDTGDKVLLIGECIEPCGFVDDIRAPSAREARLKSSILPTKHVTITSQRSGAGAASSRHGNGPTRGTLRIALSIVPPVCRACSTPMTGGKPERKCSGS